MCKSKEETKKPIYKIQLHYCTMLFVHYFLDVILDYWITIILFSGIGVDDMFVIIETWKNLSPEEENLEVPEKMAKTLSRAGVSITVTSITDMVAFGIGATTVS